MAQRVEVKLIDDLDGGDAAETVSFSLDGISYEIDLSDKHAKKLRDEFAAWTGAARRSGAGARSGSRRRSAASGGAKRADLGAVREWARANGYEVSERGRLSANVLAAFEAAH